MRIATRKSRLALWQAEYVRSLLVSRWPGLEVELVPIVSRGDVVRDRPLYEVGGIGVFTKEIQEAVLAGRADAAVHSLKDLPTESAAGLRLAAVPARGPAGDALLSPRHGTLERLPPGAVVATSSLRRRAQLLHHRPDLRLVDIRGNVETRIGKLDEEGLDGLVLAVAGIERLGLAGRITERLSYEVMLPAVGQGALGIECPSDDESTRTLLEPLEDANTRIAVDAERAFLRILEGGCQVPVGCLAQVAGDRVTLEGVVLDPTGRREIRDSGAGPVPDGVLLGEQLAHRLLDAGAAEILDRLRGR